MTQRKHKTVLFLCTGNYYRSRFAEDPAAHYQGKTIRVRGVVIRREDRPYLEVHDPGQIESVT